MEVDQPGIDDEPDKGNQAKESHSPDHEALSGGSSTFKPGAHLLAPTRDALPASLLKNCKLLSDFHRLPLSVSVLPWCGEQDNSAEKQTRDRINYPC